LSAPSRRAGAHVSFLIVGASTPGSAGFSVQMGGPGGAFGQSVGQSVVNQP
jgi:hypothetical protein